MNTLIDIKETFENDEIQLEKKLIRVVSEILAQYPDKSLENWFVLFKSYVNSGVEYDYGLFSNILYMTITHLQDVYKRNIMASRIKRQFKRSISDPSYKMCRDRLNKEFASFSSSTNATEGYCH